MRKLLAAMGITVAFMATGGHAQTNPVVIELYTSQGCSSCPPTDELLEELSEIDSVIPLALHVDYWDYIGWKDSFANPAFTKRQRGYARAAGHRTIYTPQIIVGGSDHVVGYKPMELAELIRQHQSRGRPVDLKVTREGDILTIAANAYAQSAVKSVIQVVRYNPRETVDIKRGENAGKSITYTNIVTEWTPVAEWDGITPLEVSVPITGSRPIVVILQKSGHHDVIAAARLR